MLTENKKNVRAMQNRVRELREARDWSQQDLADKVGTSQSQIDRLEKGSRRMTFDWARRLADAFEVHPLELLEPLPQTTLTDDEKEILEDYRGLSESQKPAFRSVLGAVAGSNKVKDEAS